MEKSCIWILVVRQAALSVAQEIRWRYKCHSVLMLLLACSWTHWMRRCCVVYSKYCRKKNIDAKILFYVKTETKAFTQNAYLSRLHSRLGQESRMFRKPRQINVSSTYKKHVSRLYAIFPIPLHLMFLNEKSTLCDWFSVLCIKLYIHEASLFLIV